MQLQQKNSCFKTDLISHLQLILNFFAMPELLSVLNSKKNTNFGVKNKKNGLNNKIASCIN